MDYFSAFCVLFLSKSNAALAQFVNVGPSSFVQIKKALLSDKSQRRIFIGISIAIATEEWRLVSGDMFRYVRIRAPTSKMTDLYGFGRASHK